MLSVAVSVGREETRDGSLEKCALPGQIHDVAKLCLCRPCWKHDGHEQQAQPAHKLRPHRVEYWQYRISGTEADGWNYRRRIVSIMMVLGATELVHKYGAGLQGLKVMCCSSRNGNLTLQYIK